MERSTNRQKNARDQRCFQTTVNKCVEFIAKVHKTHSFARRQSIYRRNRNTRNHTNDKNLELLLFRNESRKKFPFKCCIENRICTLAQTTERVMSVNVLFYAITAVCLCV